MSGIAHPYPLDLDALPIGAVVVVIDCWGDQPVALRVIERTTHHITGRSAAGEKIIAGGPLVRRQATADEAAPFGQPVAINSSFQPAATPAPSTLQMELF